MATQNSIVSDVGTLLHLPAKAMSELTSKACLCISSAISEAKQSGVQQTTVNIGIGVLSINLADMQCKFIPSKELKTAIKHALENNTDPLELALNQTLIDRLLAICDEVL